jgi:hypothetical protein
MNMATATKSKSTKASIATPAPAAPAAPAPAAEAKPSSEKREAATVDRIQAALKTVDHPKMGAALKDLRESLNLEPSKVMKRCGLSSQRIASIEKSAENATLAELHKLALAYDYTPGGLINRISKKS